LHLVACQLELFDHRPLPEAYIGPIDPYQPDGREKRTGSQWLKAILAYLEYGAGDGWRRLTDPAQRWHPNRVWYLNGIGTIFDLMAGRVPEKEPLPRKKQPQPIRRATPGRRREDRVA
jgi:hypothetical protein